MGAQIRDDAPQQAPQAAPDARRVQPPPPAAARASAAVKPSFAAAGKPPSSALGSFIISFDDEDEATPPPKPKQPFARLPAVSLPPAKLQSEIERMRTAIARQEQAQLANGKGGSGNGAAQAAKKVPKGVSAVKPSPKKVKKVTPPVPKPPPFSVRAPVVADSAPGLPRDRSALLTAAASADDFLKAMAAGVASVAAPPAAGTPVAKPALIPLKRAFPVGSPAAADADKRPRTSAEPPRAKSTGPRSPLVVQLKPRAPPQPPLPPAVDADPEPTQPRRAAPDELQLAQHGLDDAEIAEQRLLVRQSVALRSTPEMLADIAAAAARRAAAQAKLAAAQAASAAPPAPALQRLAASAPADSALFLSAASAPAFQGDALMEEFRLRRRAELRQMALACGASNALPPAAPPADLPEPAELVAARERDRLEEEQRLRQRAEEQQRRYLESAARPLASPQDKAAGKRKSAARTPPAAAKAAKQPTPRRSAAKARVASTSAKADTPAAVTPPAHPPLLFGAASITAVLQKCTALPAPADAPPGFTVPLGDYESPLFAMRSVRGLPQFTGVWRLDVSSPTFSHAIDPLWPLCPFDLRGECRDPSCPWQSKDDTCISGSELVSDLVKLGAVPALMADAKAPGTSEQISLSPVETAREPRRPKRPPVAGLLVPTFARAHGAAGPARSAAFRTGLLAPAAAFAVLPSGADDGSDDWTPAADARVGRYHSLPEEDAVQKASMLEAHLLEEPTDVASWLHVGLSKIGFSFDNAAGASADGALTVLARCLEVNSGSTSTWVAYLRIFSRRFTAESRDLAEHALRYVPASPVLWRVIVGLHDEPQSAAAIARRAVVALATAASAAPPGPAAVTARAAALDAGLNALRVACDFDNAAELAVWAATLEAAADAPAGQTARDAAQPSVADAVACLLQVLSSLQAAILMSAAAEAVAWRRLPLLSAAAAGCQHPDALPAIRWPSSAAAGSDDVALKLLRRAFALCARGDAHAAAVAAENYLCALAARRGAAAALAALPELQAALPSGAPLAPLLRCTFALVGAIEDRDAALERAKVLLKTAPDCADLSEARIDFLAILARAQGLDEAAALAGRWVQARGAAPATAWSLLFSACTAIGTCGDDLSPVVDIFERALELSQAQTDEAAAAARERVHLEYLAFGAQCVSRGLMQPAALGALLARRASEAVASLPAPLERLDALRDARVRALLEPRAATYTASLAAAAAAALRSLPLSAVVDVAEAALDASPGAVPIALEAARRAAAKEQRAVTAWAAPFLAAALTAAVPSPPPHLWAEAIQLCADSPDAAHELACVALQANPRSRSLRRVRRLPAGLYWAYTESCCAGPRSEPPQVLAEAACAPRRR